MEEKDCGNHKDEVRNELLENDLVFGGLPVLVEKI